MALVSDAGTLFSAPFSATGNTSMTAFTLFCWVKFPTTVTGTQQFLSLGSPTAKNASLAKSGGANAEAAIWNDDGANSVSASETSFTPQANVWAPMCGLFAFSPQKATLITTRLTTSNTFTSGTLSTSTWTQVQILARKQSSGVADGFLNNGGMLAECACWLGSLTAAEYNLLVFNQVPPSRVRPQDLLFYLPLRMNAYDYGPLHLPFTSAGTLGATFTGDHPIPQGPPMADSRLWMFGLGAAQTSQALSASDATAIAIIRQAGVRRSTTDAQTAALRRQPFRLLSAAASSTALMVRSIAVGRGATDAQSAAVTRATGWRRSAVSAEAAGVVRLVGTLRNAFGAQTAALLRTPAKRLSAGNTQASAMVRAAAVIRGTTTAQSAAVVRMVAWIRGIAQANVAALLAPAAKYKAVSASDAQIAALAALHNARRALSASSAQTVSVIRVSAKLLGAGSASVVTIARLLALRLTLSTASAAAIGQRRLVSAIRGVTGLQSTSRGVAVAKPLSVAAIAEATALVLGRQTLRSFSAAQAQAAHLLSLFFYGRALSAVTAASAASARALGVLRSAATPQATSYRLRLGMVLTGATDPQSAGISRRYLAARLLNTARSQGLSIVRRAAHMLQLSAGLAQDLAVLAVFNSQHFYFVTLDVAADSAVAVVRGTARALATFQRLAAGFVRWGHQYLPRALRSRVVWLPPPQAASSLPASVRRVLLPLENESMSGYQITQAEPQFFSPFDPTDEDTFTFDWSRRGYTNDRIVFASVTSVPAGVNFLGPAFIDGSLVDITVGPFTPPSLPFTYELRCRAVFASGRISNYSIPVVIMTL